MSQIVLINPLTSAFEHLISKKGSEYAPYPPLGILYLASVLEKGGYAVKVYDMTLAHHRVIPPSVVEDASFVGITVCTPGYAHAKEVREYVKAVDPDIPLIMGGPHVTFTAEETVKEKIADVVVRGEGEETILELAQYFVKKEGKLREIKGITYSNGDVISTPDRPFIEDLDALPFPARHHLELGQYELGAHIITGRGCPHRCIFCAAGPLSGYRYRVRSPENVIEEIKECYHRYNVDHFLFADDTFTALPERTAAICNLLKEMGNITWTCECRANNVTPALVKTMADAGCIRVQFGVESGSDYILRSIRKGITTDMVERAVSWALDANLRVLCSFIIGHPEDTAETVEQTIAFAEHLADMGRREHVVVGFAVATPFPGTELYERAEELGVKIYAADWSAHNFLEPVIDTKYLRRSQLRNYLFEAMLEESKHILQTEEGSK